LDQGGEALARTRLRPRHLLGERQELPASLLQAGPEDVVLAREDGVDRPHREPGELGDVLDLRRLEAAVGEDPLGRLEDEWPGRVVPRAAGLFPRLASHRADLTIQAEG